MNIDETNITFTITREELLKMLKSLKDRPLNEFMLNDDEILYNKEGNFESLSNIKIEDNTKTKIFKLEINSEQLENAKGTMFYHNNQPPHIDYEEDLTDEIVIKQILLVSGYDFKNEEININKIEEHNDINT